MIPTSNQDGHQLKIEKRGDEILIVLCCINISQNSFWFILKQQWTIEEISIFSNSSHLEWRAGLLDTMLNGTHPTTMPARLSVIWLSGFRFNVIFYQNMPNLHNRYKSAERHCCFSINQNEFKF
jgi:hypothetical protein